MHENYSTELFFTNSHVGVLTLFQSSHNDKVACRHFFVYRSSERSRRLIPVISTNQMICLINWSIATYNQSFPLIKCTNEGLVQNSMDQKRKANCLEDELMVMVEEIEARQQVLFCRLNTWLSNKARHIIPIILLIKLMQIHHRLWFICVPNCKQPDITSRTITHIKSFLR